MTQQSHFWAYVSAKHKNSSFKELHAPQCSQQHYLQNREDLVTSVHQQMNGSRYGAYIQQNAPQPQKQNEIKPFAATQMDLENIILSQKKMNIIPYHLYVETKKNDKNKLIYKTEIDSHRK